MGVLQVFALTLLSYVLVQAKWIDSKDVIDSKDDITRDIVGIAGGTEITIDQAPYVVALYNGEHFGVGTIIHEQFILTSASVVKNISGSFAIHYGADGECARGNRTDVDERLCHESFCKEPYNDICLLKLRSPLRLGGKIDKINLPEKDSEFKTGLNLYVTGWGMTGNQTNPEHLRRASITLRNSNMCQDYYSELNMTDNLLCAGAPKHGPCLADGGSPLISENMQIGVYSYREFGSCGRFPSVFTKVSKFVSWINETISNNLD